MTGFTEEEQCVDHDSAPGWLLREYWHPICLEAEVAILGSRHRTTILGMPLIVMRLRNWRVHLDSKNTLIFIASAVPRDVVQDISISREIDFKDSSGRYDLSSSSGQDAMALETSGGRPDGSEAVLGRSDFGVLLFRSMIRVQMEKALIANEAALAARPPVADTYCAALWEAICRQRDCIGWSKRMLMVQDGSTSLQ